MKIIINGAGGKMGRALTELSEQSPDFTVAALVSAEFETQSERHIYSSIRQVSEPADCIIDFSHHSAAAELCEYAAENGLALVIATTGHTDEENELIKSTSKKVAVFKSGNMSLGIALCSCLSKIAAKAFPEADVEIVEKHHNQKLDVPSGTALLLADAVKSELPEKEYNIGRHENGKRKESEIGIHSLRMGGEVGTHEVIFALGSQVITIKHEAKSRSLFAEGALRAAQFICTREAGLYNMDDIVE